MSNYIGALSDVSSAIGLGGVKDRSLLNIAQRRDLETILGRDLEQEKFGDDAFERIGEAEKKASNLELAGGGLGALIGFLTGGPVQAKLGWELGKTGGQLAGAGDIKRSIRESKMPENLGSTPVRFHQSKMALLQKQRNDFNKMLDRRKGNISSAIGKDFASGMLDTLLWKIGSDDEALDAFKSWFGGDMNTRSFIDVILGKSIKDRGTEVLPSQTGGQLFA